MLVHKSVAHKAEYNEELKEKEKNFKYTEQEFICLARTIRQLKKDKTRDVNKVAGERLGRTKAAIAKIRIKTEYRQAERQVKEEEEECKKRKLQRKEKVQGKERECRVWDQRSAQELTSEEHGDNETMVERSKQTEMNTPVNIKRRLPIVPPTPIGESLPLSQMLLNQQDLTIVNTPTERRKLPETPLERVRRMSSLPSWSEQGFNNASKNLPSRS